jgi:hypothetical protein
MLASSPCPNEADVARQLWPVDRIQEYMFGADRHQTSNAATLGRERPGIMATLQQTVHGRA